MENDNKNNQPNFKGDGVAVWLHHSKQTGKPYLSIKLVGHDYINAFENDKKNE
jgi:hypothetical protein